MKGLSLWLMAAALMTTTAGSAQDGRSLPARTNVQELGRIATEESKNYAANRATAIALAKKNGWDIERTYKDGTHISLQGLDASGMPVYYITYNNTRAAATTKTNQLWAGGSLGLNLSGAASAVSDKIGVWDGGLVRESHIELRGRVEIKDKATKLSDHATHVAGTMIASGQNALVKGMAFGVKKLQAYDFNNDVAEIAEAAQTQLLVSNHSYGSISGWRYNSERKGTDEDPYWEWWGNPDISTSEDFKFGFYDETSVSWDRIAVNAPYLLMVKSAGNNRAETGPEVGKPYYQRNASGNFTLIPQRPSNISNNNGFDNIPTYGNAKNILTVGAVAPISNGYNKPSDVAISSFSSWGPTDDGRIKPDIVGNGVSVLSSTSESDKTYKSLNGTSMSAPNVSGTMLLLQEHYANLNKGQVMRAATLKGLAIHTADEAGSAPGPDYVYGWGLLNAEKAANVITNSKQTHLISENTLTHEQVYRLDVVASGSGPLVVTISWTDPEGVAHPVTSSFLNSRSPRLINDLDVRVSHQGTTTMPWILNPDQPSQPAQRGDNFRDNVEQVYIPNAIPGETYTITVSHKGSLNNRPQAYSLLVSGIGGKAYCVSAPSSNSGAIINKLVFDGSTQTYDGCATYRAQTQTLLSFEPSQTKVLAFELGSCGSSAAKMAKVYVDWNGNGSFDELGEEVAVSDVISGTGTFNASITAPDNITPGYTTRLRIVLAETSDASSIRSCGSYTRGETQDYTVQFVKPARDIAVQSVAPVGASLCAGTTQSFVVKLRNNGAATQTNIPVTLSVRRNGAEVATLAAVYTRSLQPFAEDEFVLTGEFGTEAGATYELVATSGLPNDAVLMNNQASRSFGVSGGTAAPQAVATRCGNDPSYTLTGTGNGGIFWYTSATSTTPIAAGNGVRLAIPQAGSTLYAAINDFAATVGPATKNFAADGGYNQFSPDVTVTTAAPVLLERARLYIGNSGKITFTAFNADGAPVSTRTLNVKATRTTPASGIQPNDPNDQGEVYDIGLELPEAGTYRIAISYEEGATIFRNNVGVTGYPFGIANVFQITGNTANPGPLTYYYYFYDLKIRAIGCKSPRIEVPVKIGTPIAKPVVTRDGLNLKSSAVNGNQWYLDNKLIPGATSQTFTPKESGQYSVQAQWDGCVSDISLAYTFAYQANGRELKKELVASPNPSNGVFKVQFETSNREDLQLEVRDMLGNLIYTRQVRNFNGFYEADIDLSGRASGIFLLRVQFGDQAFTQRLVLQR
ncbi:S8 family serine peptidase [Pontibacter sp. JH31]|uniref:S8 family serine peptidase n=1 Tax=Pontibacter aquaedesilientis TaxID=2766980 RepID=A0ABR7XKV7_9BACT|nr:S8 family serine peptidase [Pontibacter aquaedesilientis]MBD1398924.1 S8 family serine peptidase [Pontibacter aquaedesilientis]